MKRKVTIEEIRQFFLSANEQFEESGIRMNEVRFIRRDNVLSEIEITYTTQADDRAGNLLAD